MAQEVGFRPSKLRVDAAMRAVSLVLCNDKLSTYGAPDVLQVSLDQLDAHFSRDRCFADRPSNQAWPQPDNCQMCTLLCLFMDLCIESSSSAVQAPYVVILTTMCGKLLSCLKAAQLWILSHLLFHNLTRCPTVKVCNFFDGLASFRA